MMKNIKKILGTVIVLLMAIALIIPAGATDVSKNPDIPDNVDRGSISISKRGSEFSIYKVLDATRKDGQKKVYSYTASEKFKNFFNNENYKYDYVENGVSKSEVYTERLISKIPSQAGTNDDPITTASSNFTDDLQEYIKNTEGIVPTVIRCEDKEGAKAVAENLELGFYLIVETGTSSSSATVASKSMLVPLPVIDVKTNAWNFEISVEPKDEPVKIIKSILEGKDNEGKDIKVNTSTNNIGEVLKYQVDTTIPHYDANILTHPEYPNNIKYWITDTLSKGLSFVIDEENPITIEVSNFSNNTLKLIEGEDYTIEYSKSENAITDGRTTDDTMLIKFNYEKIRPYNNLKLNYNVKINENAIIGVAGNPNLVDLEYTNNPTTGNTSKPWDDTKSYTYGLKINKVNEDKVNPKKLAGAEFQLLSGETVIATFRFDKENKLVLNGYYDYEVIDNENRVYKDIDGNEVKPDGKTAVTDVDGVAYLLGIKAGTYTLEETKAPAGYIIPDGKMQLVITEGKDSSGNRTVEYKLDEVVLPIENLNGKTVADGSYAVTTIVNTEGFNLPRTGGAGTWMFTVGGILIMASMVAVFVKLRKKEN